MFVVRAHLTLSDGTRMRGYLTPPVQGDSSLGSIQPIAVTPDGQVLFWCGMIVPEPRYISESYQRLGKSSAAQVFPIQFASDVQLVGGPVVGELPGFLFLEDFQTMRTRVLT
jgi:hypothetical protein